MKRIRLILGAALTLLAATLSAQEVQNFRPSSVVSPEITAETVTFRLYAPYATVVTVNPSWLNTLPASAPEKAMSKDMNGVWSVSYPLPASELYYYTYTVDGVRTLDPANNFVIRDVGNFMNALIVPGGRGDLYSEANRHGNLEEVWYYSATNDMNRRMTVYTPYGYDRYNRGKKYPVLYLLHGGGGDETAWATLGRTAQILDNLIEQGKAVPMLVVMPNGNPNQYAAPTLHIPVNPNTKQYRSGFDNYESLTADIIPFIEKNYNVIRDRRGRAIGGLSMGGGQSFYEGFRHVDIFSAVGIFSSGLIGGTAAGQQAFDAEREMPGIYTSPGKYNRFNVIYLSCGEQDPRLSGTENFVSRLEGLGYKNVSYESFPGAHEWHVWRESLTSYVQKLFK